jgi:hypothetical protein
MKPMYELIDEQVYVPIGCDPWNRDHCHQECPCSPCPPGPNSEVGDGKVVIKQNGVEKGSFTLNQNNDVEIDLSGSNGGGGDGGGGDVVTPKTLYFGHKGEDINDPPNVTEEDILNFYSRQFTNVSDVDIPFPAYTSSSGYGSWGFIAIPKDALTSEANDIIYDIGNQFASASFKDLAYNLTVNNLAYKVFIIRQRIKDATTFIVKQ